MPHESLKRTHHNKVFVTVMCHNDELSLTIKWVGCLLPDSEIFILFAENSRILLKMLVIPIVLTFMYLVAPNLLVNNQLTSSLWHITVTLLLWIMPLKILRLWFQPRGCIGKNLACQRAMRLKATHIEGHCEAMVGVTKKSCHNFLARLSWNRNVLFLTKEKLLIDKG